MEKMAKIFEDMKKRHGADVLIFKFDENYECFSDDAELISENYGFPLLTRHNGTPFVSFRAQMIPVIAQEHTLAVFENDKYCRKITCPRPVLAGA